MAASFWGEEVYIAVKKNNKADNLWQKRKGSDHFTACMNMKRLAKSAAAKTENAKMAALHEKLDVSKRENTQYCEVYGSLIRKPTESKKGVFQGDILNEGLSR